MPQDAHPAAPARSYLYYRHALPVRVMHWINVVALTIMFMSGLRIFNSHAELNWGKSSYDGTPPVLTISSRASPNGEIPATPAYSATNSTRQACWACPRRPTAGRIGQHSRRG